MPIVYLVVSGASAPEGVANLVMLLQQDGLQVVTLSTSNGTPHTSYRYAWPQVDAGWWANLRDALDRLASVATERVAVDQASLTRRLTVFFGDAIDPTINHWCTAHADLHWNNLLGPELGILDWESWGTGPAGLDAAILYCHSLTHPETAEQVHHVFADQHPTAGHLSVPATEWAAFLGQVDRF